MLQKQYPNARIQIPETYDGLNGLIAFINTAVASVMSDGDAMTCFMEMGIQQAIDDNVTYLEASVDLGMIRFFNERVDPLLDVVVALKEKYKSKIDFRPDIGINKDFPLEKVNKLGDKLIG